MKYNLEERLFLVETFVKCSNATLVQKAWRTKYKNKTAPDIRTIKNMMSTYKKTGSVMPAKRTKGVPTAIRQEAKTLLKKVVAENPSLSTRKAASVAQISQTLARIILRKDLGLKPYKPQIVQKLLPTDYAKRLEFAEWYLSQSAEVQQNMIFSDEAWFYLTQPINKQNNRIWAESNPNELVEKPLHDQKVMVWCGISAKRVFGPYFFDSTVNKDSYLDMLQNKFLPELRKVRDYKKYYFQQDGATPHKANDVQSWLASKFGTQWVSKEFWPPRSPDLNPCDSFLWGYLKSRVYNPLPKDMAELYANIENETNKITRDMLKNVFEKLKKDCSLCISAEGGHFEKVK